MLIVQDTSALLKKASPTLAKALLIFLTHSYYKHLSRTRESTLEIETLCVPFDE